MDGNSDIDLNISPPDVEENISAEDDLDSQHFTEGEGRFTRNQIDWSELFWSENSSELENDSYQEFNHIVLNEPPFENGDQWEEEEEILSHFHEGSITEDHEREENTTENIRSSRKYKILSNEQRQAIYIALLQRSANGKLKKNTTKEVAALFSIPMRTVQRIWKLAKKNMRDGVTDVSHLRTKNCGQKRINVDWEQFRNLPLTKRKTLRDAAAAIKVSTSVLSKNLKKGVIKRHTSPTNPILNEDNKKARLRFCLSMLDKSSLPQEPKFMNMYNIIHIDEKWFNMSKTTETYYIMADEKEPHRTCKSKNFITKIMFLAATGRPRFDDEGNVLFDGKIGIFPFVTQEPAKRSSRNRPTGTL